MGLQLLQSFIFFVLLALGRGYEIHRLKMDDEFAAEMIGVNLETIDDQTFDDLHTALLRYKVLVIRDQKDLTVEGQRSFTKRFGKLHVHLESSSYYPGYQDVNVVSNIKNSTGHYIGLYGAHVENYHSDLSWAHIPTKVTVLKSEIRPEECGDTEFLNSVTAYETLPTETKERLRGLQAEYSYLKLRPLADNDGVDASLSEEEIRKAKSSVAVHPLVTTHPITGRKNLCANPSHTQRILGMPAEESNQLLQSLFAHAAVASVYRHRYRDFDVILWDNRAVHHRATSCPDEFPRKLVRTTASNDDVPREDLVVRTGVSAAGEVTFDLAADRVNAEFPLPKAAELNPDL